MEVSELIKTVGDYGLAATVVALMYIVKKLMDLMRSIREQDTAREKDENKLQASFVEVIQSLVAQIQASTVALQTLQAGLDTAQQRMTTVSEARDKQLAQIQASIDKLPIDVKAALVDDFESIGNRLATLNKGVQDALLEWAKTGAKLQGLLSTNEQSSSGATAPVVELQANDAANPAA